MKHLFRLFLVLLTSGLLATTQKAYAQENGFIRGQVIEDASGETLIGVTVFVKGTSKGAVTDFDGNFNISIAPGTYDLQISFVSYEVITVTDVIVESGEVTYFDNIRLKESVEELEAVTVTAEVIRDSEAALLTVKRKSANLIDGISAAKFRKIGDSDAADAVKRVTGVSVEGGKYVYVRGLGDRYTKTMLNGVDVPGLDPDRNSLQIDIFPTNLIDNMIVLKSAVAEMPADFTGGIVNIETKDFPEEKVISASASITYNPMMHFNSDYLTYEGSDTDWLGYDGGIREIPERSRLQNIPTPISGAPDQEVNQFINSFSNVLGTEQQTNFMNYSLGLSAADQLSFDNNNSLGYIFSATYKNSTSFFDDYQFGEYQIPSDNNEFDLIYATRQEGQVSENSVLLGGLAGLAFKTATSKIKLTTMHLQNGEKRAANFFIDNSETAPGQSGYTADSYNLEYSQRGITNVLLNGTHTTSDGGWEVDWKVSPTFSNIADPDIRKTAFTLSVTDEGPPRFVAGAGGNPSRLWRFLDEVNVVGRLDVKKSFELWGRDSKVKFGASHTYKQRDYEILAFDMQNFGPWPAFEGDPQEVLALENIYPNGPIYYQSGNAFPNPNAYNSNVNNTGVYISGEFKPAEKLRAIIGLRAENYVQRHTGRDAIYAQGDTINGNALDNEVVLDALDLFPSLNMTYEVQDDANLRFSYSGTIARPSFKELSYAQILDPVSDRIFNGGLFEYPDWDGLLTETRIDNLDLRWEKFLPRGQLISVSAFYKSFDDPIELVRIQVATTSNEFQPRNVGDGQIFGAELELRKTLGFIAPSLENFILSSNLTFVDSRIDMTEQEVRARRNFAREGENTDDTRQMAGQAPYIINAGLQYDNQDFGLDAGFFYNVKGPTLVVVGGNAFPDVYTEPFHSLNFNLNKTLGREGKSTVNLGVTNILNDRREEFFQNFRADERIFTGFSPGVAITAGINYNF